MINGFPDTAIKFWSYQELNREYVLSWASLILGSRYVDCTNVDRAGSAIICGLLWRFFFCVLLP
jgi:hypothetical protein